MTRSSGILLSVSSLPSAYGIGCFDAAAYAFVDWLKAAGQTYWQILPMGFTDPGAANSPYQAYSAFAGNPAYISLQDFIDQGLLTEESCREENPAGNPRLVDYDRLAESRMTLLRKAYEGSCVTDNPEFIRFVQENAFWLDDFALFMALKTFFCGKAWQDWPQDIRMHWTDAVNYYREKLHLEIEFQKFIQFSFYSQWEKLKTYANAQGVEIVGDIPIYVSGDSADVWAHPELFQMDSENHCTRVAGCPPDGFSPDGQLWGNPLYQWEYHEKTGFRWWISRLRHSYRLYDMVRIDHFRGFDAYYSIAAGSRTAREGSWEKGPGLSLFTALTEALGEIRVIAEDLGFITESVRKLVKDTGFPNMKVLQFGFDPQDTWGENPYLPHNYHKNSVVYTGTHDNMTIAGWFSSLDRKNQRVVRDYLSDHSTPAKRMYEVLTDRALASVSSLCVIPIQDYLGLGNEARMNTPGTVSGNWQWRLTGGELTEELAQNIRIRTQRYGRAGIRNCE